MPALTNATRDRLVDLVMKRLEGSAELAALAAKRDALIEKLATSVDKVLDDLKPELALLNRWGFSYTRSTFTMYLNDPAISTTPSISCTLKKSRHVPERFPRMIARHELKGSTEILGVLKELIDARDAVKVLIDSTRNGVKAMLYALNTEKQLFDAWPEAIEMLAFKADNAACSQKMPAERDPIARGKAIIAKLSKDKGGKRGKNKP